MKNNKIETFRNPFYDDPQFDIRAFETFETLPEKRRLFSVVQHYTNGKYFIYFNKENSVIAYIIALFSTYTEHDEVPNVLLNNVNIIIDDNEKLLINFIENVQNENIIEIILDENAYMMSSHCVIFSENSKISHNRALAEKIYELTTPNVK